MKQIQNKGKETLNEGIERRKLLWYGHMRMTMKKIRIPMGASKWNQIEGGKKDVQDYNDEKKW